MSAPAIALALAAPAGADLVVPALLVASVAVLLGAAALRRRAVCWLLGHEVGPSRTESVAVRHGPPVFFRSSRCVRCHLRFTD
ncbi:MAG TPA: hypothetical protein VG370_03595 [Chloroflexota bacterium]|nr:hypothetical protein [Chloroflexota bacterium]